MTSRRTDAACGGVRTVDTAKHRHEVASDSTRARRARHVVCAVAVLGATLVGGCASSPPIRYHALSAVTTPDAPRAVYEGPVLEVGSVQLPPTLTRQELVRDTTAGRFEIREFDQWAAPLPRLARAALVEDLAARLPLGKVVYPGAAWPPPGASLEVDVLSLRIADGVASMVLSWSLRLRPAVASPTPSAGIRGAQLRLETPVAQSGAEATPQALNALLGQLADRVVADLASAPPSR